MMCSIRTAFLGSTFYTEPPRAMVKRKWAAWGARAKIGTRGRGLMFGNAMWWSEQAEAWFPHDLASGAKAERAVIMEFPRDSADGLRASFQTFDRESERLAVECLNAP